MKKITIVTFVSQNEGKSDEFIDLVKYLSDYFVVETFMFSDHTMKIDGINVITSSNTTKYMRILYAINNCKNKDVLCIDNDIIPDKHEILEFIKQVIDSDYGLAWGKIRAQKINSIVAKMIDIEKRMSHDYVRPLLWDKGLGISLPGQIFMINALKFNEILPKVDTVYDDLLIGVTARINNISYLYVKNILGYEKPNVSLKGLLRQRIRWAKGLAETIQNTRETKGLKFVLIHGVSFNLLWLPLYILILSLFSCNHIIGLTVYYVYVLLLARFKISELFTAIIYTFAFPIVYIVWFLAMIYYLLKICKGEKNG